jgi:hypothetical protein
MPVAALVFTVVLLACGAVAARALARMGRQLGRAGGELERLHVRMDERFLPRAEAITGQATRVVRDLEVVADDARAVTRQLEDALAAVGDITVMVEDAVAPIVATAASLGGDRRRVRAVRAGFAAGFSRLLGSRGSSRT